MGILVLFTSMCVRTQNFCRIQVLQFFVRAIYYQFVRIVLRIVRAAHDDCILCIERLLQWA